MKKGAFIVSTLAVAAVIFYGVRYVKSPVDTMTAQAQTKESRISGEGIIVYDEAVYTCENSGTFYSYTPEGERVGKNRCIATSYNGVVDEEVLQSLNNINKKIEEAENQTGSDAQYVSDASSRRAVVENVKNSIISDVLEEDVSQISEYKDKLKNTAGESSAADAQKELSDLKNSKKSIESQISHSHNDIYSTISGIYTTSLDGLEGKVKPADLAWYMVNDYKNLPEPQSSVVGSRTVSKGEPVCKVVDNHTWYTIMIVPAEKIKNIKVGDSVQVRVKELPGEMADAKIDYISPEAEGTAEYLISVKSERYLEGVFNTRKSGIELVLNSYYGYEIPISAVCVKDGKNGVMVQSGLSQIFKECNVLNRNDETGMVIVEPQGDTNLLKDGDKIVLGEK